MKASLHAHRLLLAVLLTWASTAWLTSFLWAAVTPASWEQRVAQLEQARKPAASTAALNSGDNAWMLTSSALVLMMTAPGLVLFYGGLVRRKNVLAAMMHSMMLWVTLVYFPLAHMVWGKGGMFNWALGGSIPVLDFAGGMVVHND